jgi:hypothetical protein
LQLLAISIATKSYGKAIERTNVEGVIYFSVYDLIDILLSPKDPKDYLKKVVKRDQQLRIIYPSLVQYELIKKKRRTVITANNFNILISFIASAKLDKLKNYLDNELTQGEM